MSIVDRLLGIFWDTTPDGRAFDAVWGTETRGFDFGNYEPTRPTVLTAALAAVDLGPPGVTFVDLGSGKGRVVLLASQRNWRAAVGIERRPALHRQAVRNLAAFQARGVHHCPVHLWCANAATQPLPGGPLVVFLYNPFPAHVLHAVLGRLGGRLARLVYVNPQQDPLVVGAGWGCVAEDPHVPDPAWRWRIYAPPAARWV